MFLPSLPLESVEVPSSGGVSREWVLVNVSTKGQLGSPERLIEKLRKIGQQRATADSEGDKRVGDTSPESRVLREMITVLERRVQESERRSEEAERRRQEAEGRAQEAEARQGEEQSFWVVGREEIQLTEEELGRGGWAVVKVATFRSTRVAAKCLFDEIISD